MASDAEPRPPAGFGGVRRGFTGPPAVERHVALLGTLTMLWGGLSVLTGASMLLIAAGALAQLLESSAGDGGLAAGLTAGFAVLGGFAVLFGGAHVWAGTLLNRRRPTGRVFALALAVVNLLVLPFGTMLGVYSLWVLLKNDGRRVFVPGP